MTGARSTRLLVTLDVERDYDPMWRTQSLRFESVVHVIPKVLHPLLARHGVRPTYFVGGEVLLDPDSVRALRSLPACELATHLHPEYVAPAALPGFERPDLVIDGMQGELHVELERAKLATLTELFRQQIGRDPTAFRAGRFGAGPNTAALLEELGYIVDSSVTPGVCWTGPTGRAAPDYRGLPHTPYACQNGNLWRPAPLPGERGLVEIPLTLVTGETLGGPPGSSMWFRPWYSDRQTLFAILDQAARAEDAGSPWGTLCMMFHSMELVPGASPYPQDERDVERFLADVEAVAERAQALGFAGKTMTEAAQELVGGQRIERVREAVPSITAQPEDSQLRLPRQQVHEILEQYDVQPWFAYSLDHRHERWDNVHAYSFVDENVAKDAAVLDLGCGVGGNLLWLAERGHSNLFGSDLDPKAIAAGRELSDLVGADLRLWVDDGCAPTGIPERQFAAICAMNWIQLVPDFDLSHLLRRCAELLQPGGYLVFDYIDRAYQQHPNHRWLTSDWRKPVGERRPSEYQTRFSLEQLETLLTTHGFTVEREWRTEQEIPKGVLACRKIGVETKTVPVSIPQPPVTARPIARDTVLFVVDAPGWAHDRKSENLTRHLAADFDCRTVYQDNLTATDLESADLVVIWYWRQLESLPQLMPTLRRIRHKLVMGVCSHNELEGALRQAGITTLWEFPRSVFTHSELLEREVRPLVGRGESWCLPNGVDSSFFAPAPRTPGSTLRVGWAGSRDNFGPEMRGLSNVIEPACAGLSGVELLVAAREDRWRSAEEMRAFYLSIDVYVCASRVEGTPNPCLEAAACGVPIVSTAVGNMPELLADGRGGMLIERTPAALREALIYLRDHPGERAAMARSIRAAIESEWDWRERCAGFARLFRAALDAPTGRHEAARQCRLANLARTHGHNERSVLHYRAALDADPNCGAAHDGLGRALLELGHEHLGLAFQERRAHLLREEQERAGLTVS